MLSSVQQKILKLLAINCRYTNKDIARIVHTSEDAVHYQITKLIEQEQRSYFVVTFDYKKLGFNHHHYLIRLIDPDLIPMDALQRIEEISFINTCFGAYDLQLLLLSRNDSEFYAVKKKVDDLLIGNIDESILLQYFAQFKYTNVVPFIDVPVTLPKNQKNPLYAYAREDYCSLQETLLPAPKFTLLEKKTIRYLLNHPRASYLEIAKKTNQSHESVRQQLYKFVGQGFIANFGIFHYYEKYDYFTHFFLLNVRDLDKKKFTRFVQENKNIFYAAELIGSYNIVLYVTVHTPSEFHEQTRILRKHFGKNLAAIQMLSFQSLIKSTQFPMALLNE